MHFAVFCPQRAEIAKILLEKGCDFHIKDKNGRNPFELAIKEGNHKIAEMITAKEMEKLVVNEDQKAGFLLSACKTFQFSALLDASEVILQQFWLFDEIFRVIHPIRSGNALYLNFCLYLKMSQLPV